MGSLVSKIIMAMKLAYGPLHVADTKCHIQVYDLFTRRWILLSENVNRVCHAKCPISLFSKFVYVWHRPSATPKYLSKFYWCKVDSLSDIAKVPCMVYISMKNKAMTWHILLKWIQKVWWKLWYRNIKKGLQCTKNMLQFLLISANGRIPWNFVSK